MKICTWAACGPSKTKFAPGMWFRSYLCLYSKNLITRKTRPSTIVTISQLTVPFFDPTCADRTASAMVKLLPISTTVLMPPSRMSSSLLPSTHAS